MTLTIYHHKSDARADARKRTLRTGTIIFNHRMSTMACAVYDLSEKGARLRPIEVGILPDEFELKVLYGDTYRCETIHRSKDQIGVRFV